MTLRFGCESRRSQADGPAISAGFSGVEVARKSKCLAGVFEAVGVFGAFGVASFGVRALGVRTLGVRGGAERGESFDIFERADLMLALRRSALALAFAFFRDCTMLIRRSARDSNLITKVNISLRAENTCVGKLVVGLLSLFLHGLSSFLGDSAGLAFRGSARLGS